MGALSSIPTSNITTTATIHVPDGADREADVPVPTPLVTRLVSAWQCALRETTCEVRVEAKRGRQCWFRHGSSSSSSGSSDGAADLACVSIS